MQVTESVMLRWPERTQAHGPTYTESRAPYTESREHPRLPYTESREG
jgi:hypothetical protein